MRFKTSHLQLEVLNPHKDLLLILYILLKHGMFMFIFSGYQVEQVVSIIHTDLHDHHILHSLNSIASSVLQVLPSTQAIDSGELL